MKSLDQEILGNLRSSLTNFHTVKVGYISKDGKESERVATVNYIDEDRGIVNFSTDVGFRSMRIENILFADVRY